MFPTETKHFGVSDENKNNAAKAPSEPSCKISRLRRSLPTSLYSSKVIRYSRTRAPRAAPEHLERIEQGLDKAEAQKERQKRLEAIQTVKQGLDKAEAQKERQKRLEAIQTVKKSARSA